MKRFLTRHAILTKRIVKNGFDSNETIKELCSEEIEITLTLVSSGNTSTVSSKELVEEVIKQFSTVNLDSDTSPYANDSNTYIYKTK